jgi:predicted peptidase
MRLKFCILSVFISSLCAAQDYTAYEKHYFNAPELNLPYRFLRPDSFESRKKYPLVIFLHGSYEKGFDNEKQLEIGGQFFLRDSIRRRYPSYVLFPQCPTGDVWALFNVRTDPATGEAIIDFPFHKTPTDVSAALLRLVDSLLRADPIDPSRIYIGGLSQGGMGVLDLIARRPDLFAAGFSICGAGDATTAKNFAGKTSLWLFHGDADDVVPVRFSRDYFKKLKKLSGDVLYSEYPGVKHNSWVNAFREPGLMSWLFSKGKTN